MHHPHPPPASGHAASLQNLRHALTGVCLTTADSALVARLAARLDGRHLEQLAGLIARARALAETPAPTPARSAPR